jgi:hypothetical protein
MRYDLLDKVSTSIRVGIRVFKSELIKSEASDQGRRSNIQGLKYFVVKGLQMFLVF